MESAHAETPAWGGGSPTGDFPPPQPASPGTVEAADVLGLATVAA